MKRITLITAAIVIATSLAFSQGTAINATGAKADASAMLDVGATNKGFLMPRLTTGQRNAIISPAEGLLIYNTTTRCYEGYNTAILQWVSFGCIGCQMPGAFSATAATNVSSTSFSANWAASGGALVYYLDVSTDMYFGSFVSGYNNLDVGSVTTYSITGLTCNNTYYYRLRAGNTCGTSANTNTISQITSSCAFSCGNTISDIDGNTYNTISIGSQCWLQENLKTTKYSNNTSIPNITDNTSWKNDLSGAYCDYNNTPANSAVYGRLYNWYAVTNAAGLCPTGWHVATDNEWKQLEEYLGMCPGTSSGCSGAQGYRGTNEGSELKETGTTHWSSPNTGTNTSNFTALPGGFRFNSDGTFGYLNIYGYFWTSTEYDASSAWKRTLMHDNSQSERGYDGKARGEAVRCLLY